MCLFTACVNPSYTNPCIIWSFSAWSTSDPWAVHLSKLGLFEHRPIINPANVSKEIEFCSITCPMCNSFAFALQCLWSLVGIKCPSVFCSFWSQLPAVCLYFLCRIHVSLACSSTKAFFVRGATFLWGGAKCVCRG